jgi:hypothetical protein
MGGSGRHAQALKRGRRVDGVAGHQDGFGLLNQRPVIQRGLQLPRSRRSASAATAAPSRLATTPA